MRLLGQILLWTGFLGAAVASVWRLEIANDPWSTVPWGWYGGSMLVGVCGVIMLRASMNIAAGDSATVDANVSTLGSCMDQLLVHIGELRSTLADSAPLDVVHFIDEKCAGPFSDFADARYALVQLYGLQAFAEIMTQFASGERFVNRAWSAAADGYMEEAGASLERAEGHLQRASEQMRVLAAERSAGMAI